MIEFEKQVKLSQVKIKSKLVDKFRKQLASAKYDANHYKAPKKEQKK